LSNAVMGGLRPGTRANMRKLGLAIVLAAALGGVTGATAQSYPVWPVTMIVPFAAGGPNGRDQGGVAGWVIAAEMGMRHHCRLHTCPGLEPGPFQTPESGTVPARGRDK
jgi:hypothetical protein